MAHHFVIMNHTQPIPLDLHPISLAEARRKVRWQAAGGFTEPGAYAVTTYNKDTDEFVCVDTGKRFTVSDRGIYTEAAYDDFRDMLQRLPPAPPPVKRYRVEGITFTSLAEAKARCEDIFRNSGVVVALEEA